MRDVEREWFQLKVQGALRGKRGTAFQDFFADILEAAHPGDFERVRPYGPEGDLKCDGLLKSAGTIYQVYGPREMKEATLVAKIDEDFHGAKANWPDTMRGWVFVHNDPDGLPPLAAKKIDELKRTHAQVAIETWALDRIETICLDKIPRQKLVTMFGRPPSRQDFEKLTFEPIAKVLIAIHGQTPAALETIEPVSARKLEANALSETVADYLRLGRQREHLVQQYFDKHVNPTFGDEVAAAFGKEYASLKADALPPDAIFVGLQEFAGGTTRGDVEHEAAVLAVMSYLFERCDIFEAPVEPAT